MIKKLQILTIFSLLTIFSNVSNASDGIRKAQDVFTAGLPVVAAGLSIAYGDTTGLVQLVKSEGATLLLAEALKSSIHETRPNGSDNKSFPSGHAAIAFSAAQYLQMRGGWQFGAPAYLAATWVAYSRVHVKDHYWKDVVAGGAVGALTTYYFTDSFRGPRIGVAIAPHSASIRYSQSW